MRADTGDTSHARLKFRSPTAPMFGVLAGIYGAMIVILFGIGIWAVHQQSLATARNQAAAIAAFSAAYTSRMYDLGDEVATVLAEDFSGAPLDVEEISRAIVQATERTAMNDYIVVVDAEGNVIAASEPMPQLRARVDALQAHRNGADLFVGPVVRSRLTGDIIYRISRRITAEDGAFGGYVSVAIRPLGVRPTTDRRPTDPQVSVWSDDGRFIAATFVDFRADGSTVTPTRPRALGQGLAGRVAETDGVIHAEARVEGLPLVVMVEFDRQGVLSPWRRMALIAGLIGLLLLVLGVGFAGLGMRAARRDLASRSALAAAQLETEQTLRSREMLLREVHHRVRNSLMLVSSFVTLQGRGADAATRAALERIQARVTSIGVVHETLYAGSDLGLIDMDEYLGRLLPELSAGLGAADLGIALHCQVDDVTVSSEQASTIGLIVSEAVTNAVKYAFDEAGGRVSVSARRLNADQAELIIADDGRGTPEDAGSGLGSRLLAAMARQLGGRITTTGDRGTTIRVVFTPRREAGGA